MLSGSVLVNGHWSHYPTTITALLLITSGTLGSANMIPLLVTNDSDTKCYQTISSIRGISALSKRGVKRQMDKFLKGILYSTYVNMLNPRLQEERVSSVSFVIIVVIVFQWPLCCADFMCDVIATATTSSPTHLGHLEALQISLL